MLSGLATHPRTLPAGCRLHRSSSICARAPQPTVCREELERSKGCQSRTWRADWAVPHHSRRGTEDFTRVCYLARRARARAVCCVGFVARHPGRGGAGSAAGGRAIGRCSGALCARRVQSASSATRTSRGPGSPRGEEARARSTVCAPKPHARPIQTPHCIIECGRTCWATI